MTTGTTTTLTAQAFDPNYTALSYSWWGSGPSGVAAPSIIYSSGMTYNGNITATVTFSGPGNYVFTLTVSDPVGKSTSASVTVTVQANSPVIVTLGASSLNGNKDTLSATVTDGNPGSLRYSWSVSASSTGSLPAVNSNNGSVFRGSNNTFSISSLATYFGPGTYNFTLTVTDGWGLSTSSPLTVTVPQNPPVITVLQANPSPVMAGNTTKLERHGDR